MVSDPDHHSLLAPKVAPLIQSQSPFSERVPRDAHLDHSRLTRILLLFHPVVGVLPVRVSYL